MGVLVVEVPDREVGPQPLGLVGDEPRLVAGRGRVALQVHPAVVGVDAVDGPGVGLVVGAGVEDGHLDGGVAVVGDRPAVLGDAVEERVLPAQARARRGEFGGGHLLGADGDAGAAGVPDGEHRVRQPLLEVADAVLGAVRLVVVVGHLGDADPQRRGAPGDGAAPQQVHGVRADRPAQRGVLEEAAELASCVGGEVALLAAQQVEVGGGEVVEGAQDAGGALDGGHELGYLVAAEEHGVDVVDRVQHPPGGVVRAVVALQQPLDDVQVAGVLLGAVDQRDGLGERLAVGVGDVAGVRRGEERVESGADGRPQSGAVRAGVAGVVPLHVIPGAQEEHELRQAGGPVAGVGGGAVPQGVRDGRHLRLAEGAARVGAGEGEEGVDAVGRGALDLGDEGAAGVPREVGDVAGGGVPRGGTALHGGAGVLDGGGAGGVLAVAGVGGVGEGRTVGGGERVPVRRLGIAAPEAGDRGDRSGDRAGDRSGDRSGGRPGRSAEQCAAQTEGDGQGR